jgi:hypothetical protein
MIRPRIAFYLVALPSVILYHLSAVFISIQIALKRPWFSATSDSHLKWAVQASGGKRNKREAYDNRQAKTGSRARHRGLMVGPLLDYIMPDYRTTARSCKTSKRQSASASSSELAAALHPPNNR